MTSRHVICIDTAKAAVQMEQIAYIYCKNGPENKNGLAKVLDGLNAGFAEIDSFCRTIMM